MSKLTDKVSYLKGLAAGMKLNMEKDSNKLLLEILGAMGDMAEEMQRISEQVFQALRLKQYARMDFMMDEDGKVYCLEANTLPGMTPTPLIPQEAQAIGICFEDLCEWILQLALKDGM